MTTPEPLVIAGREFHSRLILGTGKYSDEQVMVDAFDASGTEMVTVALRRVNLDDLGQGLADRPRRPGPLPAAPQHRRLLHRG